MSRSKQWSRAGCMVSALALSLTVIGGNTTAANAAVAPPKGLSAGPAGSSTPVLSWAAAKKATGYQVQVDNDSSFSSPEFTLSTSNTKATPTKALRSGTQHWRVRAVKDKENSAWRESSFQVLPINVPVPASPADGANLAQPGNPPLLQWNGSPGAESYTVEVDADSDFVGAKVYTTQSTSLVVPDPLGQGDWFWRVTAVKGGGLVSAPSAAVSFNIIPLDKPQLISPTDSVDTKVEDVVLDWAEVPGARTYDVEISTAPTFDPGDTTLATGVRSTRYSPRVTLNNDQFWWRVRAVDLNGQATTWAQTNFGFNRVYEHQPQPVYPLGSVAAPTPLDTARPFYQWTPVPYATTYQLWVDNDQNFSSPSLCEVAGTTYAPRTAADCGYISGGGTTYWTVRPLDKPYDRDGLPGQAFSVTQAFAWSGQPASSGTFDPNAEVTGMKVAVNGQGTGCSAVKCTGLPSTPVLSWNPSPGASHYRVYIGADAKFTTSVLAPRSAITETNNTMMHLRNRDQLPTLPDSTAGEPHHWYVQACDGSLCGPNPISSFIPRSTKSFEKTSPAVTGLQSSSGAGTEITFAWQDYYATNQATVWNGERANQSAKGYHIQVDDEPSFQKPLLDDQVVDQTTYTAFDRLYPEGTLYWRVQATDGSDHGLTWSTPAGAAPNSVVKASPTVPLVSPADGAAVSGTTPFRWEPQAFATSYTIEVYKNNDRSFSSVNRLFSATVKNTAYAWKEPIPADPANYVWRVRRTDADGNPGPWSPASSFVSLGAAPILTSPANGSWQAPEGSLFTWTDVPGAASYSITITGSGSRGTRATTAGNAYATVKATETGSYSWSVSAFDAAGKILGTSATRTFQVDGTPPTVTLKGKKLTNKKKASIEAKFSERVKGVSKKTMKLYQKGKKKPLKVKVKLKGKKATLKLKKGKFKRGKEYYVQWTPKRIKDRAGNSLSTKKKWKFTVK